MTKLFRMRNKFFATVVVCALLVFTVATASAALPALLLAETVLESFVIRTVAKQAVSTVTTAANDASWITTFLTWLNLGRNVGSLVLNSSNGVYEVALVPGGADDLTVAPTNPAQLRYHIHALESAQVMLDGVQRENDFDSSTMAGVIGLYANWLNPLAHYQYNFSQLETCDLYYPEGPLRLFYGCQYYTPTGGVGWLNVEEIQDPELEQTDGIKRILREFEGWTADPTDPDWSPAQIAEFTNNPIQFEGPASSVLSLTLPVEGPKLEFRQALAPSPEPSPTSAQTRNLSVQLSPAAVPIYVQHFYSLSSDTGTSPTPINFPNDYARAGEALGAASAVNEALVPKLDQIVGVLTTQTTPAEPVLPSEQDMPGWSDTFSNLLGWSLPSHSALCPRPVLNLSYLGLGTHTLDSHCGIMADAGPVIHQAMVVVFSVMALFLVLSA